TCKRDINPSCFILRTGIGCSSLETRISFFDLDNANPGVQRLWISFRSYNCADMNRMLRVLCSILVAVPLLSEAQAPAPHEKVPVIQGGAGPCSIALTITGADGKPVYAATIRVHIKYGIGGIRRLDLEAGTNSDGKVKFAGLPERVQRPPLEFHGSKDEYEGVAAFDPSRECDGRHDITLAKSKAHRVRKSLEEEEPLVR